ncbi:DUF58 domain-containing protein [Thioalkalivibrio versutus]|uniref:DUF58 domain-containing protein n=1 Tax=Thioalkalivibrio versutus TaxID=106634 RepID=UPI00039FCFAD|nr:DUF58 domain-containing protein [Thioalkalivibrio versutus]OOC50753.1 hypothetical protein B0684_02245 [Thioalkalivibrio versutus]
MRPDSMTGPARSRGRMARLRDDAIRWITRRHAHDGDQAHLGRDRIYILPTRAGYTLFGIILVMLLGSINYSNNMAFLLTFLLVGIGHNAMWYTHRNLLGLQVSTLPVPAVFAGQPLTLPLRLSETAGRAREALVLRIGTHSSAPFPVPAQGTHTAKLELPGLARGVYRLPRQRLDTRYPLGILEVWSWLTLAPEIVVYPAPIDPGHTTGDDGEEAAGAHDRREGDAPDQIRPYRAGDPPGRIVWKAFARSGKLHVREFASGQGDRLWLEWGAMPASDTETRLSMLCHQVLAAHAEGRVFGLRLPDQALEPAQGVIHRDHCLHALARFRSTPVEMNPEPGP